MDTVEDMIKQRRKRIMTRNLVLGSTTTAVPNNCTQNLGRTILHCVGVIIDHDPVWYASGKKETSKPLSVFKSKDYCADPDTVVMKLLRFFLTEASVYKNTLSLSSRNKEIFTRYLLLKHRRHY